MYDIVHELRIAVPPEQVYEAVTTQKGVAGWWTTDCELQPEAGTQARFGFEDHSVVFTMVVDILEPPEAVHWDCVDGPEEWVGTKVAFRIEAERSGGGDESGAGGASRVRFWHGNWEYEDGLLPSSSFQWAMYLDSLRRYLETGTGSPAT